MRIVSLYRSLCNGLKYDCPLVIIVYDSSLVNNTFLKQTKFSFDNFELR